MEYECKFLCQFARVAAHRMPYTSILSICTTLVLGHSSPQFVCKVTLYPFCEYPVAFQPLPLCSIPRYEKNASCGPAVSYSGSV